jgi:hypothetical protein
MATPTFLPGEPDPNGGRFPNRTPPVAQTEKLPPGNFGGSVQTLKSQPAQQGPATRRRQQANAQRRAGLQGNNPNAVQPPQVPPAATQLQALQSTMTLPPQQPQVPGLNSTAGLPPGAYNFR